MSYLLLTDVSADIASEVVSQKNIIFVPMTYTVGEEEFVCNTAQTKENMKHFYDAQRKDIHTQTSQITPNRYIDFFTPLLEEGNDLIYVSLSSGLSNTYNSALLAARELEEDFPDRKICIVDSLAATGGMGIVMEMAAKYREQGMEITENAEKLRELTHQLRHWFMVEDLMFLKRGGRISAASAIVGSTLSIKPILKIDENGKLVNIAKKRGQKQALSHLVEQYFENRDENAEKLVYITHGDAQESADALKAMILEKDSEVTVRDCILSPIIGAHTGPGMAAVIHIGK